MYHLIKGDLGRKRFTWFILAGNNSSLRLVSAGPQSKNEETEIIEACFQLAHSLTCY